MKYIYITIALCISLNTLGQIQQNINKVSDTLINPIAQIDSIRFNDTQTEMEVVFSNGSIDSHLIEDINSVTFSSFLAVDCSGSPTAVVEVINPTTGKIWMDRNLGATQAATASTDAAAYGDLYQWGRRADGHQCRTSPTTSSLSSSAQPNHGDFILVSSLPNDWLSVQNDNLWQSVNDANNPCPNGFRLPTENELEEERSTWLSDDAAGAFSSVLKLSMAGRRNQNTGELNGTDIKGAYWSSTVVGVNARRLRYTEDFAFWSTNSRANGYSVRCIKE